MEDHEKHRPDRAIVEPMFAALLEHGGEAPKVRRGRQALAVAAVVAIGLAVIGWAVFAG